MRAIMYMYIAQSIPRDFPSSDPWTLMYTLK